jgi:hypothetical protein
MSNAQEAQRGTQELMKAGDQQEMQRVDAAGGPAPATDMLASTAGAVQMRLTPLQPCNGLVLLYRSTAGSCYVWVNEQ